MALCFSFPRCPKVPSLSFSQSLEVEKKKEVTNKRESVEVESGGRFHNSDVYLPSCLDDYSITSYRWHRSLQGWVHLLSYQPRQHNNYGGAESVPFVPKHMVIKQCSKELVASGRAYNWHIVHDNFKAEIEFHRDLCKLPDCDRAITKVYQTWEDNNHWYMASEYCHQSLFDLVINNFKTYHYAPPGDNQKYMSSRRWTPWVHKVQFIFYQLVRVTQWLHSKNKCHMDLSLENTMIQYFREDDEAKRYPIVKIIDFGAAKTYDDDNFWDDRSRVGKSSYYPLEILHGNRNNRYHANSSEIYVLGIILFMLICGIQPYHSVSDRTADMVRDGKISALLKHWNKLNHIPRVCCHLLKKMLAPADRRLSMEDLLKDPFVDFQNQHNKFIRVMSTCRVVAR